MVNHKDGDPPTSAAPPDAAPDGGVAPLWPPMPLDATASATSSATGSAAFGERAALRTRLRAARKQFALSPAASIAGTALTGHLSELLATLEPECLGLYWPVGDEFDAPAALFADVDFRDLMATRQLALPFAFRSPPSMEFRRWDGREPEAADEFGVGTTTGARIVPDVVIVPCVGFTTAGYRLGYGGGYFDRWLALHSHVTTIGVAWSTAEIPIADFTPLSHDIPLTMIVTEEGVVG